MSTNDMVFDRNMNPAWCDSPEGVKGWLESRLRFDPNSIRGYQVRTGWPHKFLTVDEYIRRGRPG